MHAFNFVKVQSILLLDFEIDKRKGASHTFMSAFYN